MYIVFQNVSQSVYNKPTHDVIRAYMGLSEHFRTLDLYTGMLRASGPDQVCLFSLFVRKAVSYPFALKLASSIRPVLTNGLG
jgi:hypothetical protein